MPKLVHMHPEREEREALAVMFSRANCVNDNASPCQTCECARCRLHRSVKPPTVVFTLAMWEVLELSNALQAEIGKAYASSLVKSDPQAMKAAHERFERLKDLSVRLQSIFS